MNVKDLSFLTVITTGMINTKNIFDSLKKGEYGFENQNVLTN